MFECPSFYVFSDEEAPRVKPSTSGVAFECFGGEETDDDEGTLEAEPANHPTNPFRAAFSPHEVCGLSDTFASFSLNGYRQQQGYVTEDDEDELE